MELIKKIIVPLLSGVFAFGFAYYEPLVALGFGAALLLLSLFSWGDTAVKGLRAAALVFVLVGLLTGTHEFIRSYIVKELAAKATKQNSTESLASMLEAYEEADQVEREGYIQLQRKYLSEGKVALADLCADSVRAINARAAIRRASFNDIFQNEESSVSLASAQESANTVPKSLPFAVAIPPGEKKVTEYIMEAGASYEIRASSEYVFESSDNYGQPAFTTMPKQGYWRVGRSPGNLTVKNPSSSDTLRIEIRKEV